MKNAIFSKTKQFRAMVSIDDLWKVHVLVKEPITGPIKSKMAEIRHLGSCFIYNFIHCSRNSSHKKKKKKEKQQFMCVNFNVLSFVSILFCIRYQYLLLSTMY